MAFSLPGNFESGIYLWKKSSVKHRSNAASAGLLVAGSVGISSVWRLLGIRRGDR